MNRKELEKLLKVLERVSNKDSYIEECIHTVKRDIERFNNYKGQLKDQYSWDSTQDW